MGFLDGTGMEQRKYIRVPSHFPVKYYSIENPQAGLNPYESMSDNISIGGMMFFAETEFRKNELIRLEFTIPTNSRKIEMSVLAKVIWTDEIESGKLYNTGVEFQNLTPEQKKEIGEFVKKVIEEKKKRKKSLS